MPHLIISHFPIDLSATEKESLASELTRVITRHFDVYPGAVSIALEPIARKNWNEEIVISEIQIKARNLIKSPNYETGAPKA